MEFNFQEESKHSLNSYDDIEDPLMYQPNTPSGEDGTSKAFIKSSLVAMGFDKARVNVLLDNISVEDLE